MRQSDACSLKGLEAHGYKHGVRQDIKEGLSGRAQEPNSTPSLGQWLHRAKLLPETLANSSFDGLLYLMLQFAFPGKTYDYQLSGFINSQTTPRGFGSSKAPPFVPLERQGATILQIQGAPKVNLIHNVDEGRLTVYINDVEKFESHDQGPGDLYFKCGVYGAPSDTISKYMESRWRDIKIYKK
ncbi:hypothetical protein Tco_0143656 [Tanacetum coccineum]